MGSRGLTGPTEYDQKAKWLVEAALGWRVGFRGLGNKKRMNEKRDDAHTLAAKLKRAYSMCDLEKVAPLFAEDIQWGDKELPWKCRGRSEVLATFSRFMARGVTADVTEVKTGTKGVLVGLRVRWPDQPTNHDRVLFHVYLVEDGEIAEIQRYNDRRSAACAAGVAG